MKVTQEIRQKIDEWFEQNEQDMLADLGKLIAINSVRTPETEGKPYGEESYQVLVCAEEILEKRGFPATNFENMVVTADLGPDPPIMGILAHLDIVAAGKGWDTDPFEMTLKDGKLFGRGVLDNKGPSVASMYAAFCVRDLFPQLKHGVRLILGAAEETGCEDVKEYLKKNQAPPNMFSPDATFPVINVEKGRFYQEFSAKWAEDKQLPRVISISGGLTPNVVPNLSEAVIEGFSLKDAESFCAEFAEKTGAKLAVREDGQTLVITANGEAAHAAVPYKGVNAQTALIAMLAAMPFAESKGFDSIRALSRLHPHGDYYGEALGIKMNDEISGDLTVNFGVVTYTTTEVKGNFDSRTSHCADDVDLEGIARAKFEAEGLTVDLSNRVMSHVTPEDTPFVQTLLRVYEENTGKPGTCGAMGGSTYVHGIPGGVVFGCAMPGKDNNVHGPNEFIDKQQLIMSAKMFAKVIVEMCC
jgi:succinyl-diaminopimelate desuccinylase